MGLATLASGNGLPRVVRRQAMTVAPAAGTPCESKTWPQMVAVPGIGCWMPGTSVPGAIGTPGAAAMTQFGSDHVPTAPVTSTIAADGKMFAANRPGPLTV